MHRMWLACAIIPPIAVRATRSVSPQGSDGAWYPRHTGQREPHATEMPPLLSSWSRKYPILVMNFPPTIRDTAHGNHLVA